jgi:hypothetical protein
MKIWKSNNPTDKNIYCFYADLVRLAKGALPQDPTPEAYIPFGLGHQDLMGDAFLCQSDGIIWVLKNFPKSRSEILSSLRGINEEWSLFVEMYRQD